LPVRNKVIEPLARFLLLNAVIAGLGHAVWIHAFNLFTVYCRLYVMGGRSYITIVQNEIGMEFCQRWCVIHSKLN
jgi:hypothetical protein